MRLRRVAMTLFHLYYYHRGISINQAVKGEKWYGVLSDSTSLGVWGVVVVVVTFGFCLGASVPSYLLR